MAVTRNRRGLRAFENGRARSGRGMAASGLAAMTLLAAPTAGGTETKQRPAITGTPFVATFDTLDGADWYLSNYRHPGRDFRVAWEREQVRHEPGAVSLVLEPAPAGAERDFVSGEFQRRGMFGYGRYEVVMTPAAGNGLVSAFFVYTGAVFGTSHEEIDFEFLGRDTTTVWLNHFVDGEPLTKRLLDLGFDAAEGPNLYAFEWSPERLVWQVNGREIHRAEAREVALPRPPAKIYMSVIAGNENMRRWSGVAPDDATGTATYHCISYTLPNKNGPQCSDRYEMTTAGRLEPRR